MGRPPKPVDESTYSGRFAARLRLLREKAGLTGEDIAIAITRAGYDCPKSTYFNWENGSRDVALNAIPSIAKALSIKSRTIFPNE